MKMKSPRYLKFQQVSGQKLSAKVEGEERYLERKYKQKQYQRLKRKHAITIQRSNHPQSIVFKHTVAENCICNALARTNYERLDVLDDCFGPSDSGYRIVLLLHLHFMTSITYHDAMTFVNFTTFVSAPPRWGL
ncbi:hypothetical protein EYC84_010320 [Monilinia fructicola]|uniref:Uncharacterized protein n=1 Tax=Monilinia fructicola TaxID=38448 RepID=A0A5M9JHT6_MONFR|nr:hypothetical protein EYC84_010320 [Monilinia fructicola]